MTKERNLLLPADYFARYAELYEQHKFQQPAYEALEAEVMLAYGCNRFRSFVSFKDALYHHHKSKKTVQKVVIWFNPPEKAV